MDPLPIPAYDVDEFRKLATASPQVLSSHPCIIRGFIKDWPATRRWTSVKYLAEAFGHIPVTAGAPQFSTHKKTKMCQVKTNFAEYLKYVENPQRLDTLFIGEWSKGDAETFHNLKLPLYCGNLRLVRHSREHVLSEIDPILPRPLEYWNDDIPYYYQTGNHLWLYVSLVGALTPLHQDNNAVIAYLAQLQGRKKVILYSPEDRAHYYSPSIGYLDPLNPSEDEFPTWRDAQPWTALLGPGEMLIWGANWAHHVITQEQSITVSFDVVNSTNLDAYSLSSDWRNELGRFAKANADLIRARLPNKRVHVALNGAKEADLGREVMVSVLRAALAKNLSDQSRNVKERMLRVLV